MNPFHRLHHLLSRFMPSAWFHRRAVREQYRWLFPFADPETAYKAWAENEWTKAAFPGLYKTHSKKVKCPSRVRIERNSGSGMNPFISPGRCDAAGIYSWPVAVAVVKEERAKGFKARMVPV